jgi:hypothetical protein
VLPQDEFGDILHDDGDFYGVFSHVHREHVGKNFRIHIVFFAKETTLFIPRAV